jgi:BNR repeat-like domain
MRKVFCLLAFSILAIAMALPALVHSQNPDAGPPQFITRPILLHVAEPGLDHGHFVFGGDAAIPTPLAQNLGAATYNPANTSAGSNIAGGTNQDVSDGSDSYEGETGATGTTTLVGASNHIYPGNCSTSAPQNGFGDCAVMAYALDINGNFVSKTTISRTWNGTTFGITFDPGVDYDKNGNFYFSFGGAPLSSSYPNSVAVSKSSDGINWATPVAVTFNQGKAFDDKYYLAVDRSNSSFANRIYVSWDRNQGNNQILYISYSANGGTTWSAPIKVNDGTSKFERVIGAYPAVDQNTGVVYDSWHDYAKNIIYVDKSTDGGVTWGTDHAAATTHAGFGTDIGCVGGRAQGPAHALKVGPSGTLYLVYADPVTTGRNSRGFDILFTKSTNGGVTWSTPVVLNDDNTTSDQFHPTLSVESNGAGGDKITVTFYDRRDDPNDCLAHVYGTQSTNNGATWSANVRLTDAQSNFDGNPNGPGDYSSSTPFSGAVWPFFCDHRATNPQTSSGGGFDIYTVKVQ